MKCPLCKNDKNGTIGTLNKIVGKCPCGSGATIEKGEIRFCCICRGIWQTWGKLKNKRQGIISLEQLEKLGYREKKIES